MKKAKLIGILFVISVLIAGFVTKAQNTSALVPGNNTWISVDSSGTAGNNSSINASASGDGRYVVFSSNASNLVSGDTNGSRDVFVRDTVNNTTILVSQSTGGTIGNSDSDDARISYDGRYVVFDSFASNLVSGDTNSHYDVFVRDLQNNTTTLASSNSSGTIGNSTSNNPDISADGRFVVFNSDSTNLGSISTTFRDIYLKDMTTGTIKMLSVSTSGTSAGNGMSQRPSISCDGGIVAFQSAATNLVSSDTNAHTDIFLDTIGPAGTNTITNVTSGGNDDSDLAKVSCNGNYFAFHSRASNLVASDTNSVGDVFTYYRLGQTTKLVSVSSSGTQGNAESGSNGVGVSDDGQYVTYDSTATNLISNDTNSKRDIFIYNQGDQTTQAISVNNSGTLGNFDSDTPNISPNGKYVVYDSSAKNLVTADTNNIQDVYESATGF